MVGPATPPLLAASAESGLWPRPSSSDCAQVASHLLGWAPLTSVAATSCPRAPLDS
jgi:hypothetical protein